MVVRCRAGGPSGCGWVPAKAAEQNHGLPPRYFALFHRWFLFGIPGFGCVMAILWLMIAKPI
jgi:uncharacterized membrane protein